MKNTHLTIGLIFVILIFSSCVNNRYNESIYNSTLSVTVESVVESKISPPQSYFIVPLNPDTRIYDLMFKRVAGYIHNMMMGYGFRPATYKNADFYIAVNYGSSSQIIPQTYDKINYNPYFNSFYLTQNIRNVNINNNTIVLFGIDGNKLRDSGITKVDWQIIGMCRSQNAYAFNIIYPTLVYAVSKHIGLNTNGPQIETVSVNDNRIHNIRRPVMLDDKYYEYKEWPPKKENTKLYNKTIVQAGLTTIPKYGFGWMEDNGVVSITYVEKNSNAYVNGLRSGNVLESINGEQVDSVLNMIKILFNKNPGENIELTLKGKNELSSISYELESENIVDYQKIIIDLLLKNEQIKLLILPGEIKNVVFTNEKDIKQWKESVGKQVTAQIEAEIISNFNTLEDKIQIVDRTEIDKILEEHNIQLSGVATNQVEIGNIIGANYLLIVDLSRHPSNKSESGFVDIQVRRLIDIETGEVLSVYKAEYY